ncbi:structure-specific endonuclease subunit slx1 isoform X1 [Python bivittatus]|uniref:Structure-specific endonuclease subunit slx1 isoform X1 n=2 Tax=Python bivittatus TaxID=176946 RepID=A0A9F5IVQ3_PYTBI|nr:structure-specific endonuclease subunit slx1 isoform X1 [Python bivittatus]
MRAGHLATFANRIFLEPVHPLVGEMVVEVRGFFGVYLLYCINPRYQGRIYIGFTVNPERRIDQHNAGKRRGGAWKTSGRGPWDMVLIVHGFPSDVAALRFEWAWQHPHSSRRLTHVTRRTTRERQFDFRLRVLAHMLQTAPWCRLPLTIRWLKQEYCRDFPPGLEPPLHMPIAFGPVRAVKDTKHAKPLSPEGQVATTKHCSVCLKTFQDGDDDIPLHCFHPTCTMAAHIICLSRIFLEKEPNHILPIEGQCPGCKNLILWGDLIRHHKGCYDNLEADPTSSQKHWADELQL